MSQYPSMSFFSLSLSLIFLFFKTQTHTHTHKHTHNRYVFSFVINLLTCNHLHHLHHLHHFLISFTLYISHPVPFSSPFSLSIYLLSPSLSLSFIFSFSCPLAIFSIIFFIHKLAQSFTFFLVSVCLSFTYLFRLSLLLKLPHLIFHSLSLLLRVCVSLFNSGYVSISHSFAHPIAYSFSHYVFLTISFTH